MKINFRKSKIVGKIADNKSEIPFLESVFEAGVDVAWLNTAHQGVEDTKMVIERIRSVAPNVGIMIDTKGPEVRTKNVDEPFDIKTGDTLYITGNLEHRNEGSHVVHVDYANFHNEVPVGTVVLYDDASLGFIVDEVVGDTLKCTVQNGGTIKNKKSINTPNVHIDLPALTEKDKSFIEFCGEYKVEYIIHSFMRSKQDIDDILAITSKYPGYSPKIVAKIENREGFDNLEEILDNCDGLMVARGDLGAEVPFMEMPYMQKKMIEMAVKKGKSCIVATQVLDSMIKNPRPTRAEVLDVGNAVLEGSGAVSMSGETAYGDYPIEAITLMSEIMGYTESKIDDLLHYNFGPEVKTPAFDLAKQIADEAKASGSKAILASVTDASLLYALSAWRPSCVVLAGVVNQNDIYHLSLYYAIRSVKVEAPSIKDLVAQLDTSALAADDKVTIVSEENGSVSFKTVAFKDLA